MVLVEEKVKNEKKGREKENRKTCTKKKRHSTNNIR
jgi:hypothetical protein